MKEEKSGPLIASEEKDTELHRAFCVWYLPILYLPPQDWQERRPFYGKHHNLDVLLTRPVRDVIFAIGVVPLIYLICCAYWTHVDGGDGGDDGACEKSCRYGPDDCGDRQG